METEKIKTTDEKITELAKEIIDEAVGHAEAALVGDMYLKENLNLLIEAGKLGEKALLLYSSIEENKWTYTEK